MIDGRGGSRGGRPLGPPLEGGSGAGKAPPFYREQLLPACSPQFAAGAMAGGSADYDDLGGGEAARTEHISARHALNPKVCWQSLPRRGSSKR